MGAWGAAVARGPCPLRVLLRPTCVPSEAQVARKTLCVAGGRRARGCLVLLERIQYWDLAVSFLMDGAEEYWMKGVGGAV